MYDMIVIGGGPAGLTAAIYAARNGKSVFIIESESFGGQITYSPRIENYPGFRQISGNAFSESIVEQALALGVEVTLEKVISSKKGAPFQVMTDGGTYFCKSVIIATGVKHKKLGLQRETELLGEGISYCAVCAVSYTNLSRPLKNFDEKFQHFPLPW